MKKDSRAWNCVSKAALGLAGLCLCLLPAGVRAQEQQQGLCALVKIVISQQLTLERVGFLATLQITDNDPNNPITGFNANNYWTNIHYEPGSNFKDTYLNIFDYVGLGAYSYTVTYANIPPNTNPPVTTLMFAGPSSFANGVYYVTPATQMYFLCQDAAPVTIYDSLDGAPFAMALPFNLTVPGPHQLSFYAKDTSGNQETNHTVTLILPGPGSLGFSSVSASAQPLFNPGGALSIRPGAVPITFQASPNPLALKAQLDIFQGAVGWATVSNVPASPTAATSASLSIGGALVDFYTYQLNSGAWSAERAVTSPLSLSGLPAGNNTVAVLGRSQYGTCLDPSNAVMVSWVVDPSAPATTVTGAPATPSLAGSAQLTVGGRGVTNYKWALGTVGQNYYRAPTAVTTPILLTNLAAGPQVVDVLGQANGVFQPTNSPTSVTWTINPLYGYDQSALPNVLSVAFTNTGGGPVTYNWNGLSSAGVIQPPGWYTVRMAIADPLGNTNFTFALVQVGALAGTNAVLADVTRGPQNPSARGRWAVWQDQSDGHFEIYAQDVTASNSPSLASFTRLFITTGLSGQTRGTWNWTSMASTCSATGRSESRTRRKTKPSPISTESGSCAWRIPSAPGPATDA